jgi:hypothetical protein
MVQAQKKVKPDSVQERNRFLPTGVRVGADAISFIRSETDDSFSGYEFAADIDFYRYYLVAELGSWERVFSNDNNLYSNEGNFQRIGVDINFLKKDPEKNMFFFGARFARGTYSENLSITTVDPVWGTVTTNLSNSDLKATWGELTTGLKVKMFSLFWMGYTARYKFALNTNAPDGFSSTDVPGYGRTDKNSTWGFNYYLMFRIPVRKLPKPAPGIPSKK